MHIAVDTSIQVRSPAFKVTSADAYVESLFQQALLLGVVGFTLGCELQTLERGVLVGELVDDGLLERHIGPGGHQGRAKLFGIKRVEVVGDHVTEGDRART